MSKKSIFAKIMIIIAVAIGCLLLTAAVAVLLGSNSADLFNLSDLNLSNMIPVIVIGGFIGCVAVGILVIVLAKDVFVKVKDYLFGKENGGEK